jgi:hypothetical protein
MCAGANTSTLERMGRDATGIDYTTTAPRFELSVLLKAGYFRDRATCSGGWSWSNGERAEVVTARTGPNAHMDITTHLSQGGQVHERIYMHGVRSNLGRGWVLYFICPRTGKLCRILYRAYHSSMWRSREAFSYRLYYPQQAESGWGRYLTREGRVSAKLERLYSMRATTTCKGKPTRRALRIARLEHELERIQHAAMDPANMLPLLRLGLGNP